MSLDRYQDVRLYCARGRDLPQAKLTDDLVRQIRNEFVPFSRVNGGKAIARRLGLHPNTVWKVTSRESWAHVRDAA